MKKFATTLLLILFAAGFISAQEQAPKREFRAAWLSTVVNLDWPFARDNSTEEQKENLVYLLDEMKKLNFNAVIFQVRPECDAFYNSSYEPWSYYLTGQQGKAPDPYYDPLEFAIKEAHKRGMELHAWFNPYRAERSDGNYGLSPQHVVREHPEWTFRVGSLVMLNPGLEDVRDYNTEVIMDVVRRYDVDGVHFDDYFYPYEGISNQDQETFNNNNRGISNINDWRRDNVNIFMEQVYDSIKAEKPWVKLGVSPFGIWKSGMPSGIVGLSSYSAIYCDPMNWMQRGALDYLTPQLYWPHGGGQDYNKLVNWWADSTAKYNTQLIPGQAAYRIENWSDGEIERQIRRNRGHEDIYGSVFFRVRTGVLDNPEGFADSLALWYYRNPALPPAMEWLDNVAPNAVKNPEYALNSEAGTGAISWDLPDEAADGDTGTTFAIYRFETPSIAPADLENTDNLVGLTRSRYYIPETGNNQPTYFVVTALDRNYNESVMSDVIEVDLPEVPDLLFPADGYAEFGSESELTWSYKPVTTSYRVQFSTKSDFATEDIIYRDIKDTTFTPPEMEGETTYYWRVMAENAAGISVFSETRSFTTGFPGLIALSTPAHATTEMPTDSVTLTWIENSIATSYDVQVALTNNFTKERTILDTTVENLSVVVRDLEPNTIHWWRVRGNNDLGTGVWSEIFGFKTGEVTGVDEITNIPEEYALSQNYPNPFNPSTTIRFQLPERSNVTLRVYDMIGREVAVMVNEVKPAGTYEVTFNGENLASGVYFYNLRAGEFNQTRKFVLMK